MRNFFAGFGNGSGAFAAAAVCLVLLAAGYYVQSGRDVADAPRLAALVSPPETAPATAKADVDMTAPASPQTEASETPVKPESEAAATPDANAKAETDQTAEASDSVAAPDPAPAFDEVRREADGVTVIAGRAAPGAQVSVLQNGSVVAQAKADGSGKFATLALIPPDGKPHVLSLLQQGARGETASEDEIILAPMAPVEVAAAQAPAEAAPATADDNAAASDLAQADEATTETDAAAAEVQVGEAEKEVAPTAPVVPIETAAATLEETQDAAQDAVQADKTARQSDTTPLTEKTSGSPDKQDAEAAPVVAQQSTQVAVASNQQKPKAPQQVAVLKFTATGVELLNTPSPEAMTNVALDTISYSEVGEVELAGRAQSNTASVRVYLDNNSVVNLPVDAQGRWRGELPDVDEGIYTLRVDEVSTSGKVTSRVETPFKREASDVLVAAAAEQDGPISAITVQEGATLWAIARERYGDGALYVRVFEANNKAIRNPDLIYPGQVFDLPD
jgi:nucleoid-associated protein YgaU